MDSSPGRVFKRPKQQKNEKQDRKWGKIVQTVKSRKLRILYRRGNVLIEKLSQQHVLRNKVEHLSSSRLYTLPLSQTWWPLESKEDRCKPVPMKYFFYCPHRGSKWYTSFRYSQWHFSSVSKVEIIKIVCFFPAISSLLFLSLGYIEDCETSNCPPNKASINKLLLKSHSTDPTAKATNI